MSASASRIRVLHLTTVAEPVAGAELTSLILARELPALGIDFEVCTVSPTGAMQTRLTQMGRTSRSLDVTGMKGALGGLAKLRHHIRDFKPHILHAQLFHAGVLGALAASVTGLPFVITRQYIWGLDWYRGRFSKRLDAIVTRRAKLLIAISTETGSYLQSQYGIASSKIRVVHNAADVARFAAVGRANPAPQAPPECGPEPRIAFVASLHPVKGHTHIVAAMRLLKQRGRRVTLLLIGDGAERAHLEAAVKDAGLTDEVVFLGWRDDIPALLSTAQVYVHPALDEAFGIAVAEAMACGLSVVASRVGGIPDVVDHEKTGFLVPPADAEALAAALERLLADPTLREQMGSRGRKRALDLFGPEKLATSYADAFRTVLQQ